LNTKRQNLLLLGAISILLLALAPVAAPSSTSGRKAGANIRIGMVVPNLSIKAIADLAKGAQDHGKQLGNVEVTAFGSNDMPQEVSKVENFIAQKVDAIIIDALDSPPMVPALKKAAAAHIPVILVVTDVPGTKASLIVADEKNGGKLVGNYFRQKLGSADVGLVTGSAGDYTNGLRVSGFKSAIAGSGIHIVSEIEGKWDRPTALSVANDMLTGHPGIKGIFALNDDMAFGVLSAIKSHNAKELLVGYNGASDGLQAVWKGQFAATVMLRLYGIGGKAVDYAVAAIRGQKVPAKVVSELYLVDKPAMQAILNGTI
jgi:ribose transport system substrate-binding protein